MYCSHFSLASLDSRFPGFWSAMTLENYGKQTMLVGPWGGQDGFHWDDGVYSTIRQLEIAHGAGIGSIWIEYDRNGTSVWSEKHGGSGGAKIDRIRLEYPDEFLTSLHGHYGSLQEWGPTFVLSLTFESNKRKYGPYGTELGRSFSCPSNQGKIVGFVGKSGWYLDAIGVYMEPVLKPIVSDSIIHPQNFVVQGNERYEYSMIQGNLGPNYDLIVAVRRKDDRYKSPPINLSRQTSHDFSDTEPKNEVTNGVPKIEKVPSRNVKGGVVTSGPWGGEGGNLFDDGVYDGIRQIKLSRNVAIVSIRVCYDKNGQPYWGNKNGGTGSFKSDRVIFNYPLEILTHITGFHGPTMIMGPDVIQSLTFHTNQGKYGPFGEEKGQFFSTKLKEGYTVVGFHGREGMFLNAIGVHVMEGKVAHAPNHHNHDLDLSSTLKAKQPASSLHSNPDKRVDNSQWALTIGKRGQTQEPIPRMVKDPAPFGPGPWGGDSGKPWDDGVFTGIKQIILTQKDAICCIEIEYDQNGQSIWSVKHGGSNGQAANWVKLDHPHEILTCVSGYYGPIKEDQGTRVIRSLTFHTSRKKYGPFGEELGTYFTSGTTQGKVVGFHGRSSMYLDAIGVHMQHWLGNQRFPKPSSLMKIFS